MEKFSFFDLLNILFPGVFLMVYIQFIANVIGFNINLNLNQFNNIFEIGFFLSCSVILGSALNVISSLLKYNFFKIVKVHISIGEVMTSIKNPIMTYYDTLNIKSHELYNKSIFYSNKDFLKFEKTEQKEISYLQGRFFSIAYYDLEFNGKNSYPKTYQSFYFFFRQLLTITLIVALILIVCLFIQHTSFIKILFLFGLNIILALLTIILSHHFRKEFIQKLFFMYSIFLKQQNNKYENK